MPFFNLTKLLTEIFHYAHLYCNKQIQKNNGKNTKTKPQLYNIQHELQNRNKLEKTALAKFQRYNKVKKM